MKEKISLRTTLVVVSFEDESGDTPELTVIRSPRTGEKQEGDIALRYAEQRIEVTPEEDKRLLRKIDMYIQPPMILIIILQFIAKVTTTAALMLGFREALGMQGDMYPWVASSFYLGYLVFTPIGVRCLQRFPALKTLAIFIMLWGADLCLMAIPAYASFITWRTILGMLELAVLPGCMIVVGQWYKAEEQLFRTTLFYALMGFGGLLGDAMAYGLYKHQYSYLIPGWQVCFIIMGPITILYGVFYFFHMPDNPSKAWFLNEREKQMVVERIRDNQQGFGNPKWKWYQFRECLMDVQAWLFFLFGVFNNIGNGGLQNFSVLLLEGMGFKDEMQILMDMPCYAFQIVACMGLSYCERYIKLRMAVCTFGAVIYMIALILIAYGPSDDAKYGGYVINTISLLPGACLLSCFASNVAGHTKKVTFNSFFLIGYCVGNLIGPQTFKGSEEPFYQTAKITMMCSAVLSLFFILCIWAVYVVRNWRKEKLVGTDIYNKFANMENVEFGDFTDMENPLFRYSW